MGLGLGLSCSLSQELQLRLSHEQRLELKQQLSQKLSQLMIELRADSPDSPEQLYQAVAKEVVRGIRNPELAALVGPFLTDESTRHHIIKNQVPLSRPSRDNIKASALEYLHEVNGGTFSFKTTGADSEAKPQTLGVPFETLRRAFFDPQALEKEIETLASYMRGNPDTDHTGASRRISEMRDGLKLAALLNGYVDRCSLILETALSILDDNKRPILSDFLRDMVVLGRLTPTLSDRIQDRFIDRCLTSSLRRSRPDFETAYLNVIGEYVLVSMGIIHPDLFTRQSAHLNERAMDGLRADLKSDGLDLDQLMQFYRLQTSGTLFWHRWATLGERPTVVTDKLIRDFITSTVRADKDTILAASDFTSFHSGVRDICAARESDQSLQLAGLLVDTLGRGELMSELKRLMRERWYSKMSIFFS